MNKKKILIDVDEVICDPGFLHLINQFLNTNYQLDDFTEYYIDDYALKTDEIKEKFYQYYLAHNSYDYATLLPNAFEVIQKLNDRYDLYICSACVMFCLVDESGKFFMDKYNWLIKNFPFLDPNKFILTNTKNLLQADIQIDDRLTNLEGNIGTKLLFSSYHNKNITDEELKEKNVIRVNGWLEIEKLLL